MSEKLLDPKTSPDSLESGKKFPILRMGKLPLVLVGIIAALVIIALALAISQRANRGKKKTDTAEMAVVQPRSSMAGANALLQKYGTDGTVPPTYAKPEMPPGTLEPEIAEVPRREVRSAPPVRRADTSEAKNRRQQRVQKFREDLFHDAVVADTSVKNSMDTQRQAEGRDMPAGARGAEGMARERNRRIAESMRLAGMSSASDAGLDGLSGLGGGGDEGDPNLRGRKDEFQQTKRTYGYSDEFRRPQLTPYEVRVGSVIPAVMIGGINSDLPGEIIAQVSQAVGDTRTGKHILIPQGSRLIGTYDSHVAMGQRRVMVGWHRLQFPDGSTMELGHMGGTDQGGYAGFNDKVNNHYWRTFGNAALLSLIGAGAQLSQPSNDNRTDRGTNAREELAAELGRQWGQVGQQMIRRKINIQPTLEVRPGYQFNVMVNKDLILEPYEALAPGGQ